MTELPSPSPYAYLDALPPAERQAEIARRQHSRREDWCDDARRARDYQAELAESQRVNTDNFDAAAREWALRCEAEKERDAALSRIAELEAALEPFANAGEDLTEDFHDHDLIEEQFDVFVFRRARAALRK